MEPEEVQELDVQVQPIENNAVKYILLALADPQPIRRTERARNASDRQFIVSFHYLIKSGDITTFV